MRRALWLAALLPLPAAAQLAVTGPAPKDKYQEALEFLQLPNAVEAFPYQTRDPAYARAIALIMDKPLWEAAFRGMDERTGLLSAALIRLKLADFDLGGGDDIAYVRMSDSSIHFWMEKLKDTLERFPDDRARRRVFQAIAGHELVHVYQQGWRREGAPLWLVEGMAAYGGGERWHLRPLSGGPLPPLEGVGRSYRAYGRGLLFFLYLERAFGRPAVRAFIAELLVQNRGHDEAAAKVTGLEWPALLAREQAWSEAQLDELAAD